MSSASKLKGSAYESKIVKILRQELGLDFHRTPHSGALSYFKSDIFLPSDTAGFRFNIECKHYAEIEWNNLLTAKSTEIHQFWEQAKTQADTMSKSPLLIFRWNRSSDFVAWDDDSIQVDQFIHVNSFGHSFKITLLDKWLTSYKQMQKKSS